MIKRYRLLLAILAVVLFALSLFHRQTVISNANVYYKGFEQPIQFPWYMIGNNSDTLTFKFEYFYDSEITSTLKFIPDDKFLSLKVNEENVSFAHIPKYALQDYRRGFDIDLQAQLNPGINIIETQILNTGARGGLDVKHPKGIKSNEASAILMALAGICLILYLILQIRFSWIKYHSKYIYVSLGGLCFLILTLLVTSPSIKNTRVSTKNFTKDVHLPWSEKVGKKTLYFDFNYFPGLKKSSVLEFHPDESVKSIRVNGKGVSLDKVKFKKSNDWSKSFEINLYHHLKTYNRIEVEVENNSSWGGLKVIPQRTTLYKVQSALLYAIGLFLSFFWVFKYKKFSRSELIFFFIGIFAISWYLCYTPNNIRTFDVYEGGGHRDYIFYVKDKLSLPHPGHGWEYHQPPLYYISSAILVYLTENIFPFDWHYSLRLFSAMMFIAFQFFSYLCLSFYVKNKNIKLVLLTLILFWPSGIIHSIRIGNDVMMYFLTAIGFYYTLKWWRNPQLKYFAIASIMMFLCLITKSNGFILAGVLCCLPLLRFLQKRHKKLLVPLSIAICCLFLATAINLGDNIYFAYRDGGDWLMQNVGTSIHPALKVENKLSNYTTMDLKIFFSEAFTSSWQDWGGRQYFWNYLLKSSLFSEFYFNKKFHKFLAIIITILLTLLLLFPFSSIHKLSRNWFYRNAPMFILAFLSIAALLTYRIKMPVSCNTDFRYIYPVLISAIILYGEHLKLSNNTIIVNSMKITAVSFAIFSLLFYLSFGFIN